MARTKTTALKSRPILPPIANKVEKDVETYSQPKAKVVTIPNCGHAPSLMAREQIQSVEEWLGEVWVKNSLFYHIYTINQQQNEGDREKYYSPEDKPTIATPVRQSQVFVIL